MNSTNINLRKVSLNNRINNLISYDQYMRNPEAYVAKETIIDMNGTMLPIISKTAYEQGSVGIVANPNRFISVYNSPDPRDPDYKIEGNNRVIDFSNTTNYHEVIEKQQMVRELENEILTNSEKVTTLKIGDNNTPAMVGLKTAINNKSCDVNSYEPRFDGNFANDVRILFEDDITLKKLVKFGNAMDMKISMTIEDKSPDVPNPIGKQVIVELTGGTNNE